MQAGEDRISDHMYRMAMLALFSEDKSLDVSKSVPSCHPSGPFQTRCSFTRTDASSWL